MKEFFTRAKAEEGKMLPLPLPDGTPSEHWLKVRGIDSDTFRQAETAAKREAIELAQIEDKAQRAKAQEEAELKLIATLIAEWSFTIKMTEEKKIEFLREAPQIAEMVNRFAANRARFFHEKSDSSADGQKTK